MTKQSRRGPCCALQNHSAIRPGINQTIMAALSMLVIAALVGTRDLGQQVFIALGKANLGLCLLSGLAIALLAMIFDRMLRR